MPYTVAEITRKIKEQLETAFSSVQVEGEISNFSRPASGHCYFTLKDDRSQIRCVLWRSSAARLRFEPSDGMQVVCRGAVEVYAPRGSYQLMVRSMQPGGEGALQKALRELQARLAAEGLFDPRRKRELPEFPERIAVVTSPTAAALADFLEVLRRRWPLANVLISPTRVQGAGSANEIAHAIKRMAFLADRVDLIVVTRGGGSLEDLWSFNEEAVVRAIAASPIPVVSAIGHEIDVTLSDLAADVRALTPSEAAELATPHIREVATALHVVQRRIRTAMQSAIHDRQRRLVEIENRPVLRDPRAIVRQHAQQLDECDARLNRSIRETLLSPAQRVGELAARLGALNPLAVLARGYSITTDENGKPISNSEDAKPGDVIRTRLQKGEIESRVL